MKTLQKILRVIRVTDEHNRLSLTNLVVFVTLAKVLRQDQLDPSSMGMFLGAVVSYQLTQHRKSKEAVELPPATL